MADNDTEAEVDADTVRDIPTHPYTVRVIHIHAETYGDIHTQTET